MVRKLFKVIKARIINGKVEITIGRRRDNNPTINTKPIKNNKQLIPVFSNKLEGVFCTKVITNTSCPSNGIIVNGCKAATGSESNFLKTSISI